MTSSFKYKPFIHSFSVSFPRSWFTLHIVQWLKCSLKLYVLYVMSIFIFHFRRSHLHPLLSVPCLWTFGQLATICLWPFPWVALSVCRLFFQRFNLFAALYGPVSSAALCGCCGAHMLHNTDCYRFHLLHYAHVQCKVDKIFCNTKSWFKLLLQLISDESLCVLWRIVRTKRMSSAMTSYVAWMNWQRELTLS